MSRINCFCIGALLSIAFPLLGCAKTLANSVEQQRAAATLFGHFETVFYARADLLLNSGGYKQLSSQDANFLRVPFASLLQAFDPLGKSIATAIVGNSDAILVGAKDFHAPSGPRPNLGGVQSRFCYVLVLGKGTAFDISKLARESTIMSLSEAGVWKWSAPSTEGHPQPYTFYAREINHSYLLVSNELDDLYAVSRQLMTNGTPDLSSLRNWKFIGKQEIWGYRNYRPHEKNEEAAGTSQLAPGTQALAFFFDPKHGVGVLLLFSSTTGTAVKMNATRLIPPFKSVADGVWETRISLIGNQKAPEQMLATMSWFGFGVYI